MRVGFTTIEVLSFLRLRPYDEIAQAYLRALRPSEVQVIEFGRTEKSNAITWRVTVHLFADRTIDRITQEVEVDLPDGIDHGYALDTRARAGAAAKLSG